MSNTPTATASASVAFPIGTVLVVLLAVAKVQNLWGLGDLSWWWVFAPYWLGFVLFILVVVLIAMVAGIVLGIAELVERRKRKKAAKRREELRKQLQDGTITAAEFRRQNGSRF